MLTERWIALEAARHAVNLRLIRPTGSQPAISGVPRYDVATDTVLVTVYGQDIAVPSVNRALSMDEAREAIITALLATYLPNGY